ncbi:MAG TPA: cyclopropane-fatty-acyl-phospholipid synthase family protein, partial [Acidimicrobiales bacterium]|nr:cyclopropane-fatty-acyl-phospholipid synthase family protein [Acidimicrobiales bacterium]
AALARRGSVGLGTSYVEGWWDCDDLTGLVRILERNLDATGARLDTLARVTAPLRVPFRLLPRADKEGDRRDIKAHYDLGNEFFELMLDETMAYSCAFFDDPSVSLASAQRAKLDRLCRKLDLGPGDHVVEIGTGWGSFAVHAAAHYGCRVTTTTISDAQYEYAAKRVVDAGLGSLVTVCNQDYRDLVGRYDKLVSIEMIEAVGWRQLDTFFTTCAHLLHPDGLMGLQAIVIEDRSYERSKGHDDLIKALIFPGSFLPSIEALAHSTVGRTDLRIVDVEDIGRHYAETLRRWREGVEARVTEILAMGLSERFLRLWRMYLSYCEAAFLERHVSDVQVVLARSAWRSGLGPGTFRV